MDRALLTRPRALALVFVAVLVAAAAFGARRATILAFFRDGAGEAPLPRPGLGAGLSSHPRVRVLLIDGLSAEQADALPRLSALCARGLRLTVDNGFPTVSLPVQHVLWTGLTQQQSGLWYRVAGLEAAPDAAMPRRVADSQGVAESHPEIVGSFGFARAEPAPDAVWNEDEFLEAARAAVGSPAALAFVHVLRVDEAGHAHGGASAAYAAAATWADERVQELSALAPDARWFVLSDHGHRPRGGHGGAEPEIRLVRACVVGELPAALPREGSLHLVDLSRALADSLGLDPDPSSPGRAVAAALADPDLGATLPRPSPGRWAFALSIALASLAVALWREGRRGWVIPVWLALAYASVRLAHGPITLSNPAVYPPWGRDLLVAAAPGFLLLGLAGVWALRRGVLWDFVLAQLLAVAGLSGALGSLCGAPAALLGPHAPPPLVPVWTAHASVALALGLGAAAISAVLAAIAAVRGGGESRPGVAVPEIARRSPPWC